jgi:hypothetical protein
MSCGKLFDRLIAEATMRAPGVIEAAAQYELFDVLDEFFRNTHIWQEDVSLGVTTDKTEYDLESDEYVAVVDRLLSVVNSDNISIVAAMPVPGRLRLANPPSADGIYKVKVALTVADVMDDDGFPAVPEWVIIRYREGLKDGLLGRLITQPAKPYYSENMGKYHSMRFRTAMAQAYADMKSQNLYGGQAWMYPQNFAVGRH